MTNESIVFYQSRDTNAIISTAFQLFQDRFGEIVKIFLVTIFPFSLIVFMLTNYIQASTMADVTDQQGFFASADYWLMLGLTMLVAIFFSTLMLGIIASYFRALADNTASDIATLVRSALQLWFRYTIVGILVVLIFYAGLILLIIPGIYLGTSLALTSAIVVFEKGNALQVISRSFRLTKGNWWNTFLIAIVSLIIAFIIGILFSIPQLLVLGQGMFFNPAEILNFNYYSLEYLLTSILSLLGNIGYFLYFFIFGFLYLSRIEQDRQSQLHADIEEI
jgi:hypothetical protein